jgi:ATP-dependent DNA ligase
MPKTKATFIEPMLLLRTDNLPQGADWSYEIKLDGYRALAIKTGCKVQLRSRNDNDFTERYSSIAAALRTVPDETVLDGEVAALDEEGRPSFNLLQNYPHPKRRWSSSSSTSSGTRKLGSMRRLNECFGLLASLELSF